MNASRTTITEVEPLAGRWVRLTLGDGAVHQVDLAGVVATGGAFASIRDDREVFEAVAITKRSTRSRGQAILRQVRWPPLCAGARGAMLSSP